MNLSLTKCFDLDAKKMHNNGTWNVLLRGNETSQSFLLADDLKSLTDAPSLFSLKTLSEDENPVLPV